MIECKDEITVRKLYNGIEEKNTSHAHKFLRKYASIAGECKANDENIFCKRIF